jgi:hypothetical protein
MTEITTTVSWADLRSAHDDDLEQYRDAYAEVRDLAEDEYGPDALDSPAPEDDRHEALQALASQYDDAVKQLQKNQHVLDQLKDEYGDGDFKLKMLTGEETMEIETELRMLAQSQNVSVDVIQHRRNTLTVDAATVDAPEGVPREDGSPKPSDTPHALTMALWEIVERYNNAGAVDFRPAGAGESDPAPSPPSDTSAPTSDLPTDSTPSPPTEGE